jgi:hypothetical protein
MESTSTFSGVFKKVSTGLPDKNISYDGSIGVKKGKISFNVQTTIDGVVHKMAKKNVTAEQIKTDPQFLHFMSGLKNTKRKKMKKRKTKKAT